MVVYSITNQAKTIVAIVLLIIMISFFMFMIIASTTLSRGVPLGETVTIVVVPILAFIGIAMYLGWKFYKKHDE